MRKFLSPYFIGKPEPGLEHGTTKFDETARPLPPIYSGGSPAAINFINNSIAGFVVDSLQAGKKPLVVSGDCLSAMGCLAGAQRASLKITLLWFDAHGDFHTPQTTISGHLGGMPLAMVSGRGDLQSIKAVDLTPLPDSQIFLIGGRDLEEGEKQALWASGIRRSDRVIDVLPGLPTDTLYWVHFDTDYVNPTSAPAMRYTAIGGPQAQEVTSDLQRLANSVSIAGVSVSAWAPHLDIENHTAKTCWSTLAPLLAMN